MTRFKDKILLPEEVPCLSGFNDLPVCDLSTVCDVVEFEFLHCLGSKFFDQIKENLADYSEAVEFCLTDDGYSEGDVVEYKGVYFISLKDENKEEPSFESFLCWEFAPKFKDNECLNDLWCRHLGRYLSLLVVRKNIANLQVKIKDKGLVKYVGEGYVNVSEKDRKSIIFNIDASIKMKFELMHTYMIENNSNGCFDAYKGIGNSCCKSCGRCKKQCDNSCLKSKKSRNNYVIC